MSVLSPMRIAHCSLAVSTAALLGCSMHPLPEDVSRKNTYDIVEKIRCEAAEGLRGLPRDHPILVNTYIGYDFEFSIDETNNAGTLADRGKLILERKGATAGESLKLEGTAAVERQRKTERSFRILESLLQLSNADCSPATRANWMYPIAGAIGLQEIVRTYVGLERLTNFQKDPKRPGDLPVPKPVDADEKFPIVFSDVLTFTTNLGGGLKPTLTLNSVVGHLRITSATIFADVTRKDTHKVTVALARGDDVDDPDDNRRKLYSADELSKLKMRRTWVTSKNETYVSQMTGFTGYNPRIARSVDTVAKQVLPPETRVLLELERRRGLADEEILATKFVEFLKAP